jgi:peptidoglycan hydrolase-like protein with peptidoglycan-binding domain
LVGVGLVIVLVIGLVASGVFSGSKAIPPPTIPSTTAPPPTTAPVVPAVRVPSTVLKPGDSGAKVKVLQRALAALGDSPGKVDGSYGPSTQAALERFQKAHNLTADGIFGPATRRAMIEAVKKL